MKLIAIGSVAFDSVKTPFGEVERAVGGSATYFSLCASYFADTAVVGVVGEDFTEREFALFHEKGIDTRQIRREKGKSFFWKGVYNNINEAETLATELNVFADFRPEIHPDFRSTPVVFLGNIDPDLQIHVLDQMKKPAVVGLDTMNLWINLKLDALVAALRRVDILFINDGEARMLSGERNLLRAAAKIRSMGPKALVIKRGEYGAAGFFEDEVRLLPAFPVEEARDTTGAGDSFAGGFMGYIASQGRMDRRDFGLALRYGTVMASFNVEDFSVERVRRLTFPEITDRLERFRRMLAE
ncbi:MAG: sugar kinase [Acidobacteria bacterium]|nr:sugar kinase [Acidobacteriota bacterium]